MKSNMSYVITTHGVKLIFDKREETYTGIDNISINRCILFFNMVADVLRIRGFPRSVHYMGSDTIALGKQWQSIHVQIQIFIPPLTGIFSFSLLYEK